MFDNLKRSEMAQFNRTRSYALAHALTVGVRLARRPDGIRVDEQNTTLMPDQWYPRGAETYLSVGKKAKVNYANMCLWGLPPERYRCYPSNSDTLMISYVLLFGRMSIVGKCRVEGEGVNVVAIARRNRHYDPTCKTGDTSYQFCPDIGAGSYIEGGVIKDEAGPAKLLLYPLNCFS